MENEKIDNKVPQFTEAGIIKRLTMWVDDRKFPFQMANAFIYGWECDYWAMDQAGITREFEIKISRSDFLCDSKKGKHTTDKGANYFYYVCPKDLLLPKEIDNRYGLIYIWEGGHVSIEKKPKRLHDRTFEDWKMLANKLYWRYRQMWKDKYIAKEITHEEYHSGLLITEVEPLTTQL